ncbi:T9SS type A sorting domain-containing protein [bacterium]|nr:T9SS type A sorting domain-containing protein [bacterium]
MKINRAGLQKKSILLLILVFSLTGAGLYAQTYDFGDAPSPYPTILNNNGAYHLITQGVYLGSKIDAEQDGQPDTQAKGDDNDGTDDEDGVNFTSSLVIGSTAYVTVTASVQGYLNAWIDFNRDGDWGDAGEQIFNNRALSGGNNNLSYSVPAGAQSGDTFARFRFSMQGGLSYKGSASDGEVEDYILTIQQPLTYDFGDAPSPYPTLLNDNGAYHIIQLGYYLGSDIDKESDGQPDSTATGDDNAGRDDEDGVEWLEDLVPGDTSAVIVTASAGGNLKAWIDWNRDGDWKDEGEEVLDTQIGQGANELDIFVPSDAVEGYTYTRFRYSGDAIPSAEGEVSGGEVEDMRIYIENLRFYDYGDAPDDETYHYHTLLENDGARHTVSDTIYLGDINQISFYYDHTSLPPDLESNGQPNINADGDNINDNNDERGSFLWRPLVPGDTSSIFFFLKGTGTLHGWFDWNQDGDWNDAGEYAINYTPTPGPIVRPIEVAVPESALLGSTYARFRYSTDPFLFPYGKGGCGEVEDRKITVSSSMNDFGDAPESYGTLSPVGASHPKTNILIMGELIDAESDGIPSADASGDDDDGFDDEDGVVFPHLIPGEIAEFEIETWGRTWLFNPLVHAWIDFNYDGDFNDEGEKILDGIPASNGIHTYGTNIPADVHLGSTYARFRYTHDPAPGPEGHSNYAGEVEDYRVRIGEMLFDYGDAPYPFKTSLQENGARHIIVPGIHLGLGVDAEEDGLSDSLATGDKDDGITFKGAWVQGDTVTAYVSASVKGYIFVWACYANHQGLCIPVGSVDPEDVAAESDPNTEGLELYKIPIAVPLDAGRGAAYFRFRFSTMPIDSADGIAVDGEVEDYRIFVHDGLNFPGEYGDAPEGIMAYPDKGVLGSFPTLKDDGPAGFVRHGTLGQMYFGYGVDYEIDGNAGSAAPVGDAWDTDEGLNDRRGDVVIYRDLGLTDPCNYTIRGEAGSEFYWPYSVLRDSRGVLGQAGETVTWGDYRLDLLYHVTRDAGAYLNVLIDWDQDGSWGGNYDWFDGLTSHTTAEHIIQNFHIPKGEGLTGIGKLSDLDPPEFVMPDDVTGYVWTRWTITDSTIAGDWDGSGIFSDGETEDYLIAVNYDSLFDFGDAPQGALAYPASGVMGEFQTAFGLEAGVGVAIWHHHGGYKYFGNAVDYEWCGNAGLAYHTPWIYDADENYNNELIIDEIRDAGLRLVVPYRIQGSPGSEFVVPYVPAGTSSLHRSIGGINEIATWGVNLDMAMHLLPHSQRNDSYFSLVIDWDQDGFWHTSEWVIKNFHIPYVNAGFYGMLSEYDLPDFDIGSHTGYVWARFIISERPVNGWYGVFSDGETEDYLLHVSEMTFTLDFGDAPLPFPTTLQQNGARHMFNSGVYLGSGVDAEEDGRPDSLAMGDDYDNNIDDDDGVVFQGVWVAGDTVTAIVSASTQGYLSIWSDFKPPGSNQGTIIPKSDFEYENIRIQLQPGSNEVEIIVPDNAEFGKTPIRFRFSTQPIDSVLGIAPDGEVEDYMIEVFDRLELPYEYGDAPEAAMAYPHLDVIGQFPTLKDAGSSGFVRHGTLGEMYLGHEIDYEADGNAGLTPPFDLQYDADERLNEIRTGTWIFDDIGLIRPIVHSLKFVADTLTYWPYGVYNFSNGTLGEAGQTAEWDTDIDVQYTMTAAEGGYANMLIDWNQDGQWSGADEHVLINFHVPAGIGQLSDLDPPDFIIGNTPGHAWMRFTLSDIPVAEDWDGSGNFADGETEDYLICISYDGLYDYGDAPDGAMAYPSSGVIGSFPTWTGSTATGYIRHRHGGKRYFGQVDYEYDGNGGLAPLYLLNYNSDESFYDVRTISETRDAGLRGLFPHNLLGGPGFEFISAYDDGSGLPETLGRAGALAEWGSNLDLFTRIIGGETGAYVNILIDWNQDGDWKDIVDYPMLETTIPERVLGNFRISGTGGGLLSTFDPPAFRIGPNSGFVWMRCTITKTPVEAYGWDGSGEYVDGETEDYLLKIDEAELRFDYGDAPLPFRTLLQQNGARHLIRSGVHLGNNIDADTDGQPDSLASGDDYNGNINDEDGVSFEGTWAAGDTVMAMVQLSVDGYLGIWGDFYQGQKGIPNDPLLPGNAEKTEANVEYLEVPIPIPVDAANGPAILRFRFSTLPIDSSSGISLDGEVEDYMVMIGQDTGVEKPHRGRPDKIRLHQNWPNPFNPVTHITFELPTAENITIKIFDIRGRHIKTVTQHDFGPGIHTVLWDAQDKQSMPVASGIYIIQMSTKSSLITRKIMLLK